MKISLRKIGWRVDCVHRYRLSETFFASFYPGKKRFIRLSKGLRLRLSQRSAEFTKAFRQTLIFTAGLFTVCLIFRLSFTPRFLQLQELRDGAHIE